MWLLVKFSFDINDHILSLFVRKMCQLDGILHLFDTLHLHHPSSLSVLLCLAECACIVETTSNVLELLGDMVLMMACSVPSLVVQAVSY